MLRWIKGLGVAGLLSVAVAMFTQAPSLAQAENRRLNTLETDRTRPLTDREVQEILQYVVWTEKSYALEVDLASLKYKRTRSNTVFIEFEYRQMPSGVKGDGYYSAALHPDGRPCLWTSAQFNIVCDRMITSELEANRLESISLARNEQYAREKPARDREEADEKRKAEAQANLASLRREAGASLNAQDRACLIPRYEERQVNRKTDQCEQGDYVENGGYICNRWVYRRETITVPYEVNKCSRPIRFRDKCGNLIWTDNVIPPGARFDARFREPCERVY